MEEQLISLETAKLAKKKGFDTKIGGHSYHWYKNEEDEWVLINCQTHTKEEYPAPTQSLLQKWLRDEYGIHVSVNLWIDMDRYYHYSPKIVREMSFDEDSKLTLPYSDYKDFRWRVAKDMEIAYEPHHKHEQALEKGLQKALKLLT